MLFRSWRYFHHGLADSTQRDQAALKQRTFGLLVGLSGLYTIFRIARTSQLMPGTAARLSEWQGIAMVDALFVVCVLLGGAWLYRKSRWRLALGLVVVGPFAFGLWASPVLTAGLLALAHNVVGFVYWVALARSPRDRRYALASLGVFLAVSALILAGAFAPLYPLLATGSHLDFAGLSFHAIGSLVLPWAEGDTLLYATAAFAFGQSTHYYVWLKAIPDQGHDNAIPTSFRQSLRLLRADFGPTATQVLIWAVVASFGVWLFLNFQQARVLYFVLAGFHGLVELAGLPLLSIRTRAPVIDGA